MLSDYLRLQSAHLAAVINGDVETFRAQIHDAGLRKDEAKYAVLTHREQHGCGWP